MAFPTRKSTSEAMKLFFASVGAGVPVPAPEGVVALPPGAVGPAFDGWAGFAGWEGAAAGGAVERVGPVGELRTLGLGLDPSGVCGGTWAATGRARDDHPIRIEPIRIEKRAGAILNLGIDSVAERGAPPIVAVNAGYSTRTDRPLRR